MARTVISQARTAITQPRQSVADDGFSLLCRDGVTGYATINNTGLVSAGTCSFTGWVKWIPIASGGAFQAIFTNRTGGTQNFSYYLQTPTTAPKNAISCIFNTTSGGTQVAFQSTGKTLNSGWNHVAFTRSGTSVKHYLNGVLTHSETIVGTDFANPSTGNFTINALAAADATQVRGNMKDYRWFKSVELTQPQIVQIMNRENPVTPTGWWKMDERSGTTLNDSSGNGYNMAITNLNWSAESPFQNRLALSESTYAIETDGNNDHISYGDIAKFAFGTGFTYGLWVDPVQYDDAFMSVYDNLSATGGFNFRYHNDSSLNLYSRRADGTLDTLSTDRGLITTNRFIHLAFSVSASGTTKVYANGKLVATGSVVSFGTPNTAALYCGYNVSGGNMQRARYSDMWIYQSELTAQEIYDIVWNKKYPASPYARWKCTEGTGTTIADSSGNGRTATLVNGAIWTPFTQGGARTLAA